MVTWQMAFLPRYGDLNHNWVSLQRCVHLVWVTVSLLPEDGWALLLPLQPVDVYLDFTPNLFKPDSVFFLCYSLIFMQDLPLNKKTEKPIFFSTWKWWIPLQIDQIKSSSCKMHPLSFLLGIQSWIKSNVSMQFCTLMRVLHASLLFVCAERFSKGMLLCKHRWCSWQKHDYCWKRVHVGTLTESPGSRVTLYIGCIKAAGPSAVWPVDSCTAKMLSNREDLKFSIEKINDSLLISQSYLFFCHKMSKKKIIFTFVIMTNFYIDHLKVF